MKPASLLVSHPTAATSGLFRKSVILVTENWQEQHSGLILNRPIGASEQQILQEHEWCTGDPDCPVYVGGPMQQHSLALIHTSEWSSANTLFLSSEISISSDHEMIESVARGYGPEHKQWICGLSTWDRGQLEQEVQGIGYWKSPQWLMLETDAWDHEMIWNTPKQTMWQECVDLYTKNQVSSWF